MEILNNIWLAISTPNQDIVNIILLICVFMEAFMILLLFTSLSKIKPTWKQTLTYILVNSCLGLLAMWLVPAPFNIFINYIFPFVTSALIFRKSVLKLSISIVVSLVIFNLIGMLLLNPFLALFKITSENLRTIPMYRTMYMFLIYMITVIIILIIRYKDYVLKITENIDKKNKIIIISNLCFGIFAIIVQSITLFYYVDMLPIVITLLSFISLLIYFGLSFYSLTRILKLISTTKKLESAEAYNNSLRVLHDSVRSFKHDFDNTITTIGGFIMTNDIDGLKKYYKQLQADCQNVNNLYLLNPSVVNNDGIFNLVTKKYQEADSKNIRMNLSFLLDLQTLHMPIYEFARILGILLDNAIEASSLSSEKIINLTFRNDSKHSRQLIIVENTFSDENIDTEKIYEKGSTSKPNHTGLGLWTVRKILNKHNNINLYTSIRDDLFSQQLEIYY